MRLKIETYFKVSIWDSRFLLKTPVSDWTKAVITDQGLDRIGDSFWISGIHVGTGKDTFLLQSTGLNNPIGYSTDFTRDESKVQLEGGKITWSRELEVSFAKAFLGDRIISELSLSWDRDERTSTALVYYGTHPELTESQSVVIECKVLVHENLDDIETGTIDFGASLHNYVIKPCFYTKYENSYIGTPLAQKAGKVYSGSIPTDVSQEPTGSIDTNLANFNAYSFETRSKTFDNFFTLSSPNAVTRTATSHTFGLPSAYGVEFDPPIDKDFNRELALNFKINWNRG